MVPCYQSGDWLESLVERTCNALGGHSFELLLINDGSRDDVTWDAIKAAVQTHSEVIGLDLARNVGQFAALMCGLANAGGELIVTMDDDLQHSPEEIPRLIEALDDETDVVIGSYEEKQHGGLRNLGTRFMDRIYSVTYGKPPQLKMGSFRVLRRSVVDNMLSFGTVRPVPGALILQTTARIKNIAVTHNSRQRGSSGYSLRRLVAGTLDNVVNSSTGPLRVISLLGFMTAFLAAVAFAFYLLRALFTDQAVPGFSTTVSLITFFGGATLLAIGVLGEYVVRLVIEAGRPPLYSVRSRVGQRDGSDGT